LKVDPYESFKTKAIIRNLGAYLGVLQILKPFKSGRLQNSPEARRNTTKEMLKMKDDPDELLKTMDEKMTLFDIPMST
jgi:hypothetical protein